MHSSDSHGVILHAAAQVCDHEHASGGRQAQQRWQLCAAPARMFYGPFYGYLTSIVHLDAPVWRDLTSTTNTVLTWPTPARATSVQHQPVIVLAFSLRARLRGASLSCRWGAGEALLAAQLILSVTPV